MPSNTNTVTVSGNLTRDPEEIANGNGAGFSLAVNESFKKKGSDTYEEYTNFFEVAVWGGAAGPVLKFLEKGARVVVTGRLKQERWEKDGQKRSAVKIHAQNVEFMPKNSGAAQSSGSSGADDFDGPPSTDDDIPF